MTSRAVAELAQTESVFDALAHAQRRQILLVLRFRGGEMTAGERIILGLPAAVVYAVRRGPRLPLKDRDRFPMPAEPGKSV